MWSMYCLNHVNVYERNQQTACISDDYCSSLCAADLGEICSMSDQTEQACEAVATGAIERQSPSPAICRVHSKGLKQCNTFLNKDTIQ